MVAPGNVNPNGIRAPLPPGQGKHEIKAAGVAAPAFGHQGLGRSTPRTVVSSTHHNTEMLHHRGKFSYCPARMAIGGFAVAVALGFVTLYTKKKQEDAATDVAKVVITNVAPDENTRSHN